MAAMIGMPSTVVNVGVDGSTVVVVGVTVIGTTVAGAVVGFVVVGAVGIGIGVGTVAWACTMVGVAAVVRVRRRPKRRVRSAVVTGDDCATTVVGKATGVAVATGVWAEAEFVNPTRAKAPRANVRRANMLLLLQVNPSPEPAACKAAPAAQPAIRAGRAIRPWGLCSYLGAKDQPFEGKIADYFGVHLRCRSRNANVPFPWISWPPTKNSSSVRSPIFRRFS